MADFAGTRIGRLKDNASIALPEFKILYWWAAQQTLYSLYSAPRLGRRILFILCAKVGPQKRLVDVVWVATAVAAGI